MRTCPVKSGFTLIEMLLAVAIIVILVAMVVGLSKRIDDQGKERLCRETLGLIDNALEQFRDFGYEYKGVYSAGLDFPMDCTGFDEFSFTSALQYALGLSAGDVSIIPSGADPNQLDNSGSEALYFFLSQVPDCRTTIDRIDKSLISNKDKNSTVLKLKILSTEYPLLRFVDPWRATLRYDYYDQTITDPALRDLSKKTFPIITSAGPDGIFDTADDIINRQPK